MPKIHGMFGRAVYLTTNIRKTFGYTDNARPMIFVAEAVLGRVRVMDYGRRSLNVRIAAAEGFDTAHGKGATLEPGVDALSSTANTRLRPHPHQASDVARVRAHF